jgi:hypothetical protein
MALTSVAPSGRNSFWYTSAVKSAMINFLSAPGWSVQYAWYPSGAA